MKTFITEFKENIPAIAEDIFWATTAQRSNFDDIQQNIEEVLKEWVDQYESDGAEEEKERMQFYNDLNDEEESWGEFYNLKKD